MSEPEEPRWELLPYDAEGFFGLEGEYDLRDLKRSYNQLIRRFKPEKFPQEFQRIRAGFEALSDALRFNLPTGGNLPPPIPLAMPPTEPSPPQPAREPDAKGGSGPGKEPNTAKPANATPQPAEVLPPTPAEALRTTPPRDVYRDLREKPSKTPGDYVALAFLADVVGAKSKSGLPAFFEWLLAGLAKHPSDWGLVQLVREYLLGPHSPAELAALLRKTAAAVPSERFQYATERAWDRLLREGTFNDFGDCLRYCGERLGRSTGQWQLMFYVHVLPAAVWKADDELVSDLQATVEDHFHTLEPWVQAEYETISLLLDYRVQREAFIARGPACRRIDEAIRDWCLLPEMQADLSVLESLYFVAHRGQRLLEEFPDPKESLPSLLLLWDQIVSDVLERQEEPPLLDPRDVAGHTRDFMVRVHRRNSRTGVYYRGLAGVYAALMIVATSLITSVALLVRMFWRWFGLGWVWSGVFDGLLAVALVVVGFVAAVAVFIYARMALKLNYGAIRGELIKLLRVAPLPVHELAAAIEERENEKYGADNDSSIDDTALVARGLQADPAMALFSLAQVGMRAAAPIPIVDAEAVDPEIIELAEAIVQPPSRPVGARLR